MNQRLVKTKMQLAETRSKNKQGIQTGFEILGSGPLNKNGVPTLPPDQKSVDRWPVLDLGVLPDVTSENWKIEIKGLCGKPGVLDFATLKAIGESVDQSDFHCVTGWSKLNMTWKGVRFSDLARHCQVHESARYIYVEGYDHYSTNLPVVEAMKSDVLLAYEVDGKPLPKEHGGPVRMITPQLWAWKGAKWISSVTFLENDRRGFWEERGYSNSAIPWLNDRYTADEVPDDESSS
ncbi:MAG: molybdopterin-dependent oxidoreductase [Pseudobdellovibrionaceae bacterium]